MESKILLIGKTMTQKLLDFIIEFIFISFLMTVLVGMLVVADHMEERRGIKNNMLSSGTLLSETR